MSHLRKLLLSIVGISLVVTLPIAAAVVKPESETVARTAAAALLGAAAVAAEKTVGTIRVLRWLAMQKTRTITPLLRRTTIEQIREELHVLRPPQQQLQQPPQR